MSVASNSLIHFEELIQNGGIQKCYEKFRLDEEMLTGTVSKTNLEYYIHEQNQFGDYISNRVSFEEELNNAFENAFNKTMILLSNEYSSYKSNNDLRNRINFTLDSIYFLHQQTNEINTYQNQPLVTKWLLKLIGYIKNKYYSANVSHKAFELIEQGKSATDEQRINSDIFGFLKGSTHFKELYDNLVELDFFNDEDEQYHRFKDVLTSFPKNEGIRLKIKCNNQKAAYILRAIKPLFDNLTFTAIDNSKIFFNKKGKLLNKNDLSKALDVFDNNIINGKHQRFVDKVQSVLLHNFEWQKG